MADVIISNRYRLVKSVGEGGMATVYLAIDEVLRKEVAIKILKKNLVGDEVALERFKREAKTISSTSHTNIVEVYDVGQDGDQYYIVMEFVRGKTLKQLVRTRGIINLDESVNIMKQLVSAVSHAHKSGIIHRDIKSQNVLIKDDGIVKLSDFGIAIMGDNKAQLTQTQTVVGSVHYMAPELAAGQQASVQSDIYALGIVFYEMLMGDVPFHGDTAVEIALKHMHDPLPSIRAFNPAYPQAVENIIIRATAKKKEQRYRSAEEMFNDLATCLDLTRNNEEKLVIEDKKPANAASEKPAQPPVAAVKRKKKKREKVDIFPILAAVLLGVVLLFIIMTLNGDFLRTEKVTIPEITGWQVADAQQEIIDLGLTIEQINYEVSDDAEKGEIISISPSAGTEVSVGSSVTITVSLGSNFTIEDYTGMQYETVKNLLEAQGFNVTYSYVDPPEGYSYGEIVSQSIEAGTIVAPNTSRNIRFEIADHVSYFISSSLKGRDVFEVKDELEAQGITVILEKLAIEENIDENGDYIYALSTVVSTDPAFGTYYIQTDGEVLTIYYY